MNRIIYIALLITALTSCARLEDFTIDRSLYDYVSGYKMNGLYNVDVARNNEITLHDSARISLSKLPVTNHETVYFIKLIDGTGVRFYFRTNMHDFHLNSGIMLELTATLARVYDGNKLLTQKSISISSDEFTKLKVINHGNNIKMYLGCDDIFIGNTHKFATEHVIVETIPNSTVILGGIEFNKVVSQYENN